MNKSHARKPIWWYRSARDIARNAKIFSSPGVNIKAKQKSGTRRNTIQSQKFLTQTSRLPIKIDLENTIKR